ncbi:hypothetical protein AKJ64_04605 [candidate division MSBL1 archaeon SCGC-AAA259E17]|uniref:MoaB/Mog domain-containing protein n=1 Tax=candidate division MSBL1 archaeon SCGC-AAA259E17 TaxID=1698263 RepID=A0A133UBX5_9EURY|nr:hypothetical protein AKJ64_04605 [candidate division MSBL1 archaeon SCGC-AAA259E17]
MKGKKREFSEYIRLARALELILSEIKLSSKEKVTFEEANGRVLAEDVEARANVPPFDRAAMDGFAVQAEDTFGAGESDPKELEVVGSVEIGDSSEMRIESGEAAEISTGAPMPSNADSVVKVEDTYSGEESRIMVISPVSPGKNVSSKGEDVKLGEKLFEAGHRVDPSDVGILASSQNLDVEIRRRPEVGILATGSELRKPGTELEPGEITEINTYTLDSAIRNSGGSPERLGIVPDDADRIEEALGLSSKYDLLLVTGGTSVGKKDIIPDVIAERGNLIFHGIAMRPGGPVGFGMVDGTPVFSLPGFPAATLIAFEMAVKPALLEMQGTSLESYHLEVRAELDRKINSNLGRLDIIRTKLSREDERYVAEPIRLTGSSILTTISRADGLIVVPENKEGFKRGDEVPVKILEGL